MRLLSKTATYEDNIYHFTLNFHWGRGSFTLHAGIGYSCIYEACVSPTLDRRSLVASALNTVMRELPHMPHLSMLLLSIDL